MNTNVLIMTGFILISRAMVNETIRHARPGNIVSCRLNIHHKAVRLKALIFYARGIHSSPRFDSYPARLHLPQAIIIARLLAPLFRQPRC